MNAIVAGKQEKQSGAMVFKKQRDLNGSWATAASQALTVEEINNSYLYCEDMAGHIAVVALKSMSIYPDEVDALTRKTNLTFYLADNATKSIFSFYIANHLAVPTFYADTGGSSVGGTGAFLKTYCIGTLKIT